MRHLASGLVILLLLAGCRGGSSAPNTPLIKSQPELTNGNGVISVGGGNVVGNVGVKTSKPSPVQPGAAPTQPLAENAERSLEPEDEASEATDTLAASDATTGYDLSAL